MFVRIFVMSCCQKENVLSDKGLLCVKNVNVCYIQICSLVLTKCMVSALSV